MVALLETIETLLDFCPAAGKGLVREVIWQLENYLETTCHVQGKGVTVDQGCRCVEVTILVVGQGASVGTVAEDGCGGEVAVGLIGCGGVGLGVGAWGLAATIDKEATVDSAVELLLVDH